MSAAIAGRFQDHYEVLAVDHKALTDVIQAAYARLSAKYNPRNGTTPDQEKFDAVNLAFEILSNPELRLEFDRIKGIGANEKPKFSGRTFFNLYGRDNNLRVALLCVLYDRRRSKPFTPSLSMRHLESILSSTSVELNFALWYLKQRDLVSSDDKSSLQITVSGMEYLQNHPPNPDEVMLLIREDAPMAVVAEDSVPASREIPSQTQRSEIYSRGVHKTNVHSTFE
jgi:curved DNA-binding protein CbpA